MNRPIHFEILADDPEATGEFYKSVFGWDVKVWEGPPGYWLVTTGETGPGINGAIMNRQFNQPVINTMEVESLDAMIQSVEASEGKIVHGPTEIPGVGRHAYFADPEGNLFGLMEPISK